MTVKLTDIVTYNDVETAIKDLDPSLRYVFGWGHMPLDVRERPVRDFPGEGGWAYAPHECLETDIWWGVWLGGDYLVCPGCGLDFT